MLQQKFLIIRELISRSISMWDYSRGQKLPSLLSYHCDPYFNLNIPQIRFFAAVSAQQYRGNWWLTFINKRSAGKLTIFFMNGAKSKPICKQTAAKQTSHRNKDKLCEIYKLSGIRCQGSVSLFYA